MKVEFPVLTKLCSDNHYEFKHQLIAQLKRISSEKNVEEFNELMIQFKKELINDSPLYIESLNDVVRNLLLKPKLKITHLYKHFLFLAQIGDTYTAELLKKILPYFQRDSSALEELRWNIKNLGKRLRQYEADSDELKLFPMIEIFDQWID